MCLVDIFMCLYSFQLTKLKGDGRWCTWGLDQWERRVACVWRSMIEASYNSTDAATGALVRAPNPGGMFVLCYLLLCVYMLAETSFCARSSTLALLFVWIEFPELLVLKYIHLCNVFINIWEVFMKIFESHKELEFSKCHSLGIFMSLLQCRVGL